MTRVDVGIGLKIDYFNYYYRHAAIILKMWGFGQKEKSAFKKKQQHKVCFLNDDLKTMVPFF